MPRPRLLAAAAVLAIAAVTLTACSEDAPSSLSREVAVGQAAGAPLEGAAATASPGAMADQDQVASGAKANPGAPAPAGTAAAPAARQIRTADIVLQVDQLPTSAARVRAAAQAFGGHVESETTTLSSEQEDGLPVPLSGSGPSSEGASSGTVTIRTASPGESVIVLRVPVNTLDSAVDKVATIGKELARTSSAVDVTGDLADLGSRVKTAQASVERVRALLAKAESLSDIVLLEAELTRREADLEALQARQTALADRADLSTLTVTLRTPEAKVTPDDGSGFLAGLKSGWHAVVVSTGVVLTVVGALLPVVLALGLLGLPFWVTLWRRRRNRRRPAPTPTPATPRPAPTTPPATTPPTTPPTTTPPTP